MVRMRGCVATAVCVLIAGQAWGQPNGGSKKPDPVQPVYEALRARHYDDAIRLVDQALEAGQADAGPRELLSYCKGLALLYSGQHAVALAHFDKHLAEFPAGIWADKARFRKADAHVALKQYDAAEKIYAERVKQLVGSDRKAKIAKVYLAFAEEYFKPADTLVQPDYAKAMRFYDKALDLEPGDELRDELLYKRALCNQKIKAFVTAVEQYNQYLLIFDTEFRKERAEAMGGQPLPPASTRAGRFTFAARQGLGESHLELKQFLDARRVLQDLRSLLERTAEDDGQYQPMRIAALFLLSRTYQMPTPPNAENLALGVDAIEKLLAGYPGSKEAIDGAYDIGAAHAHLGRSDEAIKAFQALINRDKIKPGDDDTRKQAETLSQKALFEIGRLYAGQRKYADAIGSWNQYIAKYPTGPQWSAAQQAIVDTEYRVGADAQNDEKFEDARTAWAAFLQKYPLDPRCPAILYAFGDMAFKEQGKKKDAGQTPDWNEPINQWNRLVSKFPSTEEAGRAQYMIGAVLEDKVGDLEGAIAAYRNVLTTSWKNPADQRIAEMNATRLTVVSERVFRTNEPAKVRVDVRNIDKLTVKVYRVDLEDYFRKSQRLGGVETLDLLLIDPDKTFEVAVDGYARHKPVTQEITVPFDGPGAFAVNVSNESSKIDNAGGIDAKKLEATTLLIRSDIDIIVKASRKGLLVFAEDMVTQHPAAGVKLLVSDGAKIILESATKDDGVSSGPVKELKDPDHIVVLAQKDGHVAGNALALSGLGFSTGLAPRGYLYTDRPAYRPGDAVNIRGVLREVVNGQYALPKQSEDARLRWKLDVIDPKGRVLRTDEIGLSEFGGFAAQFRVAEDAPVGDYRLIARRADGPSFAGAFSVQTYARPQAYLTFDYKDRFILRGAKIAGSVVLKYHYGEPVTGKTIQYEMVLPTGDTLRRSGVTDAAGKVAFEFESTVMPEEGTVRLSATQADMGLSTSGEVFVAVRAFRASVSTPRPLYLSEEPVEATIEAKDLADKPLGVEMTLTALLRAYDNGRWSETRVDSTQIKTDDKTGKAAASLKLTKGGVYVLRAEGKDKFDHLVTAEATVQVSDDKDATRVRLFSEKQTYRVGDTISVDLHSRLDGTGAAGNAKTADAKTGGPAGPLALITFEGEDIIGYKTMRLSPGHNALQIPVENAHFPNFAVGAAVMADKRLHVAAREFSIERRLTVTLTPDRSQYRPRDEMTLNVKVTDQQCKPVQAEVGVAVVDNALLSIYPDATPAIVDFFQAGARREAALRAQSSYPFRYEGRTREMISDVLAEAQRLADAAAVDPSILAEMSTRGERGAAGMPLRFAQPGLVPAPNEPGQAGGQSGSSGFYAFAGEQEQSLGYQQMEVSGDGGTKADDALRLGEVMARVQLDSAGAAVASPTTAGIPVESAPPPPSAGPTGGRPGAPAQVLRLSPVIGGEQMARRLTESKEKRRDRDDESEVYFTPRELSDLSDRVALGRQIQLQVDECNNRVVAFGLNRADSEAVAGLLRGILAVAPPQTYFPEVAYWNPRVVTDAEGKATLKIVMPDTSTTWKVLAKGVTKETLCGQGEAEVVSKQDFFAEVVAPPTLIEADSFTPIVRVHCLTAYKGDIEVVLRTQSALSRRPQGSGAADGASDQGESTNGKDGSTQEQKKTLTVDGSGVFEATFDPITAKDANLTLEATATTLAEVADAKRKLSDVATRIVPVRPWGMRYEAHAGGVAGDTDFVEVELPQAKDRAYHDLRLTVAVGPNMQRWLIEEALESGRRWEGIESSYAWMKVAPPRTHADTSASLLACLYAADYVRASQAGPNAQSPAAAETAADMRLLDARIAGLIGQLLAAQNDDGGWGWCGSGKESDAWTSGAVAWALGKARAEGQGVAEAASQKLTAYLKKTFADASPAQTELKAAALHGLAWIDTADFGHANRLYRNRQSLSSSALAHLALTFVKLDRKSIAQELLAVLDAKTRTIQRGQRACRVVKCDGNSAWAGSELEVTAMALLARLSVDPRGDQIKPMVDYLTACARAEGWRPHKARGPAMAALATYFGRTQQERAAYTLAVSVNGKERRKVTPDDGGSIRVDLSGDDLRPGKQRVDFAFSGRGEYAYAVTLSGFSTQFPSEHRRPDMQFQPRWRHVPPPPPEYKGRVIQPGFSVAARWNKDIVNMAFKQPIGAVLSARVPLSRYLGEGSTGEERDYLIVQETIPAGFRLLTDTIRGRYLAYDYADNVLTLYYGSQYDLGELTYQMVATTPGHYRLPPTTMRSVYRPDLVEVNNAEGSLDVLPRDRASPDAYRMSPDELYTLGRRHFEGGEFEAASKFLSDLLAGDWVLRDEPYRESVRLLLTCALARGQNEQIVNYFEILKERFPELLIPFEQIIRIAEAYAATGQSERAYLVYRATADASFARDSGVGAVLQGEGRFLESIDFLDDLVREYPDTPQVESFTYAMTQVLYAQASKADGLKQRRTVKDMRRVTSSAIIREAIARLERFVSLYPESPIVDEASYSLLNAYLDLDEFHAVVARADELTRLFPKSKWVDRFRYVEALARFNLSEFDKALALAEQVSKATYVDEQGVTRPSPNKWLALYIMGQIFHARGDTAKAIEYYGQVKGQFSDAGDTLGYFEQKYVRLPEVTIFHPDTGGWREATEWEAFVRATGKRSAEPTATGGDKSDAAAPSLYKQPFIKIDYRNVASAVLQVYRVDLMKLALVEKNLSHITGVNLAGVKPIVEETIALGDGKDYVDKSRRVDLDVAKALEKAGASTKNGAAIDGAYLVICRGDNLLSTGLVLVTPLAVEVQEDPASQRARVVVVDAIQRGGMKNVHVKVIGTSASAFVTGDTDLRGVFVADAVNGYPTAIARDKEGHVAFYRSPSAVTMLAMARQRENLENKAAFKNAPSKADYRSNTALDNRMIQSANCQWAEGVMNAQQKGVEVQKAQ